MNIRDIAVQVVVGAIILLSFSKWVGRVQFSLSNAFWASASGHFIFTCTAFISVIIAGLFPSQPADGAKSIINLSVSGVPFNGIVLLGGAAIGCFLTASILQVFIRTQDEILLRWRALTLSVILFIGDFLVASPLIECWEQFHK